MTLDSYEIKVEAILTEYLPFLYVHHVGTIYLTFYGMRVEFSSTPDKDI